MTKNSMGGKSEEHETNRVLNDESKRSFCRDSQGRFFGATKFALLPVTNGAWFVQ